MNNIAEIFNKENQSNYLKQIKNTFMANNISSNYFNNMKTNNNNRNNYIYFANNPKANIHNKKRWSSNIGKKSLYRKSISTKKEYKFLQKAN